MTLACPRPDSAGGIALVRWGYTLAAALPLVVAGLAVSEAGYANVEGAAAVEGHSTYAVIELAPEEPPEYVGLAVCDETWGPWSFSLPQLLEPLSRCARELGMVFATPSVFAPPGDDAWLEPTGRERTVTDGHGVAWTTKEYVFPLPSGAAGVTYGVPIGETLVDDAQGEAYNFRLALVPFPKNVEWTQLDLTVGPAP